MLRAISLRESWMREIRTSGLTRERAPNGPSLLYMRRRSLQRKEPDCPATILFCCSDSEIIGIFEDDDEHEEECSISEFRLKRRERKQRSRQQSALEIAEMYHYLSSL